ncbi:hypothetical protein [Streptosporangium sp. NPDC051022]|uniref:hypothetical protein n=1 Tax=Streptosporangium sp. NPDC051022 TaxID=3155752 RepID=UPI003422FE5F
MGSKPRRRPEDDGWIVYEGPARLEHAKNPGLWRPVRVQAVRLDDPNHEEWVKQPKWRFSPSPAPIVEVRPDRQIEGADYTFPFDAGPLHEDGEWLVILLEAAPGGELVRLATSLRCAAERLPDRDGLDWEAILDVVALYVRQPVPGPGCPGCGHRDGHADSCLVGCGDCSGRDGQHDEGCWQRCPICGFGRWEERNSLPDDDGGARRVWVGYDCGHAQESA